MHLKNNLILKFNDFRGVYMYKIIVLILTLSVVSACNTKNADYKAVQDKTAIETKAERDVNDQRSSELERDLQERYRFYQAVKNTYVGQFKIGNSDYGVKLEMIPSIPLYQFDRVRTIEEVSSDLNTLSLNSQIVIWNLKSELSASGCVFQDTKPNFILGQIVLVNKECPNTFSISFGEDQPVAGQAEPEQTEVKPLAQDISKKVLSGEVGQVDDLYVTMQPTYNAQAQKFILKRK